jgi:hypothetical protein
VGKARRGRGDEGDSDRQRQGPKSERLKIYVGGFLYSTSYFCTEETRDGGRGRPGTWAGPFCGTAFAPLPCYCGIVMEDMEGYCAGLDCTNCDFVFG